MASLSCPDCGSRVNWSATGCAACGATFREIRCRACKYVGTRDRFPAERCPRCEKNQFQIVPLLVEEADVVGDEAFVEDAPLVDEIERSFTKAKPKPLAEPVQNDGLSKQTDPRPVLKRKRWQTAEKNEAAPAEPQQPAEMPNKSVKTGPISPTKARRIVFKLPAISTGTPQSVRWLIYAVPVVVLCVVILVFAGSRGGRRPAPRPAQGDLAADPAAIEAQAMALYNAAVEYYRGGKVEQAGETLHQVVALFPLTAGGNQARQALDRMDRGEPPFDIVPVVAASDPVTERPSAAAAPPEPAKKKAFIGIRPVESNTDTAAAPNQTTTTAEPKAPAPGSTLAKSNTPARPLPEGFVPVPEAGVHQSGWPIEIICLKDQAHMMLVPAGEFMMGDENAGRNAQPVHRVQMKAFYIDRYEITLTQYEHFLEQRRLKNNPYRALSAQALAAIPSDHHPVVGIAWRDAKAYADWAGKTLPTEAQWEKAARGGDARIHPWGAGSPAWEKTRLPNQLDPVGSFAWDVSPFGCFDMAGNAWEWCADWYDPGYYQRSPGQDPAGPAESLPPVSSSDPEKVIRGGSPEWSVVWRGYSSIETEPGHVGFRCVMAVEGPVSRSAPGVVTELPPQPKAQPPARIPPGGYKF